MGKLTITEEIFLDNRINRESSNDIISIQLIQLSRNDYP